MDYSYTPAGAGAVFVDGIATGVVRGFTPDISWTSYCAALRDRRPVLPIEHLQQPHDWRDILIGKAPTYAELVEAMARDGTAGLSENVRYLAVFGFSLGGLTALRVAHALADLERDQLQYVALVTLGTPFIGTGRVLDPLLRRLPIDYLQIMLAEEDNQRLLEELLERTRRIRLRILVGEIERDEMVSASSALTAAHWLSALPARVNFKWGTFRIPTGSLIRAHDGLLQNEIATSYINGLLDGLLPETP